MSHMEFEERPEIEIMNLVSNCGGIMGVLLGLSAISIVEFMYLIYGIIVHCVTAKRISVL